MNTKLCTVCREKPVCVKSRIAPDKCRRCGFGERENAARRERLNRQRVAQPGKVFR